MGNIIQSIPEAKLLLASLRSVGYTEETAIADIVDNCISAKAKHIDIIFETEKMRILILDDGIGMTAQALIENMRIGSSDPSKQRDDTDLGRFGMGMKTAAFSLGKRLTVVTRFEESTSNAAWDLDKIPDIGWNLIIEESDSIAEISSRLGAQGTVVCIENLDRVIGSLDEAKAKKKFYKTAEKVEKHLALIFHRFIEEDGLVIRINGTEIQPWNPFVINNNATQELADETIWSDDGASEVVIQPYVLPHRTKFASDDDYQAAGGAKGWNYHQGVYVYRNRRLIICGTWFDYIKKEPAYNLARIKVDISSVSDEEWKIDIKKSTASLPGYVRDTVERAIDICTEASARVYNSRGTYSKSNISAPNLSYVWEQRKKNGRYSFHINRKHALLTEVKKHLDTDGAAALSAYLTLVENFAPFMLSGVTDSLQKSTETAVNKASLEYQVEISELKEYIALFLSQGFTKEETRSTLLDKQYTSGAFMELLQKCGTKQSFSATGQPHDNAVAETFFATFKKEDAYRREYTSEQSFRRSVEQYIAFYNETRPRRTLKYKTPKAFEDEYLTKKGCSNSDPAKK